MCFFVDLVQKHQHPFKKKMIFLQKKSKNGQNSLKNVKKGIFVTKITNTFDFSSQLDGVGPVDNRPSTYKLHQIVRKKREKNVTCDMGHVTCDM